MTKGIFVTGTDTGIGKTFFTVRLMQALAQTGLKISGMKPVATGATFVDGVLVNEDAVEIQRYCSTPTPYRLVNPVVFEAPVAPHIAAKEQKTRINLDTILSCYRQLQSTSDLVVVEGIGGWRVPLSGSESLADLVRLLELPVILVVGLRLGCINHALLTREALVADGVTLCGWVSNQVETGYLYKEETIFKLNQSLVAPHVADLPYVNSPGADSLMDNIDLKCLLGQL